MSLFTSLRTLYRADPFMLEDSHTEIVARVLENSPEIAFSWLREIGATEWDEEGTKISVRSQHEFIALPGHDRSSRIDLTIRLQRGPEKEIIFIESKVDSSAGHQQLQHYADHLANVCKEDRVRRASLVYVTRDFEAVTPPNFIQGSQCRFLPPTRWFIFARHLREHAHDDALSAELLHFMKENNMSLSNRFRPSDIIVMQQLLHVKSLMDETLDAVKLKAGDILGVGPKKRSRTTSEIQHHGRYVLQFALGKGWDFECLIGYWFSDEHDEDSPWVGVEIQSNPSSKNKDAIRKAFGLLPSPNWEHARNPDPENWSGSQRGKRLLDFMSEPDYIQAIKRLFDEALNDVKALKDACPDLPWGPESAAGDPDVE